MKVQLQLNGVDAHGLPPKAQIRAIQISRGVFGGADAGVTILYIMTLQGDSAALRRL